jgi:hypothetical protein
MGVLSGTGKGCESKKYVTPPAATIQAMPILAISCARWLLHHCSNC